MGSRLQKNRHKDKLSHESIAVLIIENDELERNMMVDVLKQCGYTPCVPGSPENIFKLVTEQSIDVILCQTPSPLIDSYQLLKDVRSDATLSKVVFIFVCENNSTEEFRKGMGAGADDVLAKPYYTDDLLLCIQARLSRRTLSDHESIRQLDGLIHGTFPHQMRTPVTMVIGAAYILQQRAIDQDDSELKELSAMLEHSGNDLNRITENFITLMELDLLKYDHEKLQSVKKTELQNWAEMLNTFCRTIAEKHSRGPDLKICDHSTLMPIFFGASEFEKMLCELVDNAFKFSKEKDIVTIETKSSQKYITVTIEDLGRGLSAENIANIGAFTQFGREFYEQQGLGLGLVIAQKISDLFDARLSFAQNRKVGTKITIRMRCVGWPQPKVE